MAEASGTSDTTKKSLLAALEASLGVVTTACKRAGIARSTYYKWLGEDDDFKASVAEITDVALDFGESQLHKLMQGYTLPETKVFLNSDTKEPIEVPMIRHHGPDAASVIFFLKTKGKERGYTPPKAIDITSKGQQIGAVDYDKLSDDAIAEILNATRTGTE